MGVNSGREVGFSEALVCILNYKWQLLAVSAAILLLVQFTAFKQFFMVVFLTLLAAFSTFYKRYIRQYIGFELVTLATVLCTVAYGPVAGAFVGFVSSIAAEVIPALVDFYSLLWFISLPVSAFAVSFFHGMGLSILWLAVVCVAVQLLISESPKLFSGSEMRVMVVVSVLQTIAWNLLAFRLIAEPVLSIM